MPLRGPLKPKTKRNSTKLDKKEDLNVPLPSSYFEKNRADRKNKMSAQASGLLRNCRILWNRLMEFNETWLEARSQSHLPIICFSDRSEKQDGRLASDCLRHFQLLNWSCISQRPTTFVFFGLIGKTRWPPRPLIGWDIFDFSSKTAEWNWRKLDRRKQDLKVLFQVCFFFGPIEKKKQDCRPVSD